MAELAGCYLLPFSTSWMVRIGRQQEHTQVPPASRFAGHPLLALPGKPGA
jgi:hypothetical protein